MDRERNTLSRKRRPPPPPVPKEIDPRLHKQHEALRSPVHTGKIRTAKDSSEFIRVPRRIDVLAGRPSIERDDDDPNARHFTVANVGAGGTLYLKPSRLPPNHFAQPPATPPDTSDGEATFSGSSHARQSNASGSWTPRARSTRPGGTYDHSIPVPPLSLANIQPRRRSRSHSFSTVGERVRSPTWDQHDFQLLVNGTDATGGRPKSSIDLPGGLLDLHIPHYRLGTPRFSERGTAYLHTSTYTSASEDVQSSVFSRAEYDKLFPAPPGRIHGPGPLPHNPPSSHLHPSSAQYSRTTLTPPVSTPSPGPITPNVYDRVEANINDPAIVRYSAQGRIAAATPARLIVQITSPMFLDYELLSDFFLTYRAFLSSRHLLEYLLARLTWAFGTPTDSGRIVRVRTFVAIRHWILNYFSDDFASDAALRERFCDLVNDLARKLARRFDGGGSDLKIVGELKKCWRRTCAMFWPVSDARETSAEADIGPGGELSNLGSVVSATSLPLDTLQRQVSKPDFRPASAPLESVAAEPQSVTTPPRESTVQFFEQGNIRKASIPASPMSEQSLQVLSCSVPFLRNIRPSAKTPDGPRVVRPAGPQRYPALHGDNSRGTNRHKRSGSFTDALRDGRTPLPSNKADSIDIQSLRATALTGGLVRGLLLQPSPATVNMLIPISPGLANQSNAAGSDDYFDGQNATVRRLVGDVRRALSTRKARPGSPNRSRGSHRSTNSSSSHDSTHLTEKDKIGHPSAWQQLQGPRRVDTLADRIGKAYAVVFQPPEHVWPADQESVDTTIGPSDEHERPRNPNEDSMDSEMILPRSEMHRYNSRVTAGSRSIVIMDDTGADMPRTLPGALPSVSSWASDMAPSPLFRMPAHLLDDGALASNHTGKFGLRPVASYPTDTAYSGRRSSDIPLHDLLSVPGAWGSGHTVRDDESASRQPTPRKSSSIHPFREPMPPLPRQLRRLPGGDLRAADNVRELEPAPRPHSAGSFSTTSRSGPASALYSPDLSGTHFSGQGFAPWRLPRTDFEPSPKQDSIHLLELEPKLRPSFEAEVSRLARLPDPSREGGIEETLRKLEGAYEDSPRTTTAATDDDLLPLARQHPRPDPLPLVDADVTNGDSTTFGAEVLRSPLTETQGASIYHLSGTDSIERGILKTPQAGASTDRFLIRSSSPGKDVSPMSPQADKLRFEAARLEASPKSVAFAGERVQIRSSEELKRMARSDSDPTSQGSFLLDDDQSLSDISTEIADQVEDDGLGVRSFFFDDTVEEDDMLPQSFRGPPTPPSTVGAPPDGSPDRQYNRAETAGDGQRPLKEAQSAPKLLSPNLDRQRMLQQQPMPAQLSAPEMRRVMTSPGPQTATHLPFVLAFESEVIAEQLTIIEKDALDEVDWKDLIGLHWQQSPPNVRNWVHHIKKDDLTGVDIVVARFNLVVKWVVSEIVLTAAPSERARAITKYIHIATHCHRFRNYASMYQITLALLSVDLARLHMTWALVAPAEKQELERLEKLCQPLRNFHNLRVEMEASSVDSGCIPFIGLYTHDLMFNAQKPPRIDASPLAKEPLINFERYQTAATIVKSLLRLIEASSKYIFHPHPEVLSRCLWLAALEDAEITRLCRTLEA